MRAILAVAAALSLAVVAAQAQTKAPAESGTAAQAPPAAQVRPGPPTPGGGRRMGMHWGARNTFGWSMMSAAERQDHMARMRGFTDRKACEAYVADHHRLMADRAKQRGLAMPTEPRGRPCAGLN